MRTKTATAKELDKMFDAGVDMSGYMDPTTNRRHNKECRLTVHVSGQVAEKVEREAVRQGVTKQRLIEDWITDRAQSLHEAHIPNKGDRPVKGGGKKKAKAVGKTRATGSKLS
jgi:predicted DNA binding CopG/RHH family protein